MDLLVSLLLPLAIAFVMFSLGVGLHWREFRFIAKQPRAFLTGAICQIVILPVAAYGIVIAFGFTAETAVGVMILAACPGGVTSNIVARLLRWDVALSVTLTAAICLTCVITLPLILDVAMRSFMASKAPEINMSQTAFAVFLLSTLPVACGVTLRSLSPRVALTLEPHLTRLAVVLFAIVIASAIASNWVMVTNNLANLGAGLLALVALSSAMGFFTPYSLGCSRIQARTISLETGVQNGSLGIGIAALVAGTGDGFSPYAIPAAVYSVVYLATVLPMLLLWRVLR